MRMFAKFLVFANLILSLVFLAWSISLYTQRLDWAPHRDLLSGSYPDKDKDTGLYPDETGGRLNRLLKEVKELVEHRDLAEKRWQYDGATLVDMENKRLLYQKWYDDQRALAHTGRDMQQKPVDPPIIQLERIKGDPIGLFIMDPKQRKSAQTGGKDLKSIEFYQLEYNKLKTDIDNLQGEILKLQDLNKQLTLEIAGDPGKTLGLRKKVDDLILQKKEYDDEIAILKPLLAAQRINTEQQKRRMEELDKRLKDLQRLAGLPQLPPVK